MTDKWAELYRFLNEEYTGEAGIYAIQSYDNCVFVIASNQAQVDAHISEALADYNTQVVVVLWPLLSCVDLSQWMRGESEVDDLGLPVCWVEADFDWVIVGGESGPNARPMHPDWVRLIRDQCQAAEIPFLFKQWGDWEHTPHGFVGTENVFLFPDGYIAKDMTDFAVRRGSASMSKVGKRESGRILDGRTHDEFLKEVD